MDHIINQEKNASTRNQLISDHILSNHEVSLRGKEV